jgi:hypothetical protein
MLFVPDWLQQWLKDVGLWNLVLIILLAAAAAWLIRRFITRGWPALKRFAIAILQFAKIVDAVADLPAFIERTDKKLAEVHHETHKNDGSSIKDSSDRTELAVKRVEQGVAGLYKEIESLKQSDVEIRTHIGIVHQAPTQGES